MAYLARLLTWKFNAAVAVTVAWCWYFPWPSEDPAVRLVRLQSPMWHEVLRAWSLVSPGVIVLILALIAESVKRVWFESYVSEVFGRGELPAWPQSPDDPDPSLVIGEQHHRTRFEEVRNPRWLVIPKKGLFTGLLILGAVGTGKTTSCMRPFTRQLLTWQAGNEEKRAAALCLEVKGDFCFDVKKMLDACKRSGDYIELNMKPEGYAWNPLAAPWLDSSSLAGTIASLLNQLYGKGKEPFWQQAYTNVARWVIELKRLEYPPWVTMADLYEYVLEEEKIAEDVKAMKGRLDERWAKPDVVDVCVDAELYEAHREELDGWEWERASNGRMAARIPAGREDQVERAVADCRHHLEIEPEVYSVGYSDAEPGHTKEEYEDMESSQRGTLEEVERWLEKDWKRLAEQTRTNVAEGLSVFLSMFALPDVKAKFCPPCPDPTRKKGVQVGSGAKARTAARVTPLPSLEQLIEQGRVVALNLPAGKNPELGRTIGVMLKQAWLGTLLLRPERMAQRPGWQPRPAVFICDEYQAFVTAGEGGGGGDEKAFALTRQSKCIPIVATQSLSSLRSVLGSGEVWRTLLQTLRSRIYLSQADDQSAKIASDLCGQVTRMRESWSVSENTGKAGVSLLSGRTGGAGTSAGITKSFQDRKEALFSPREFTVLENYSGIAQIFDGKQVHDATRVYLKPDYVGDELTYWRAREAGKF